jgi:hypothetical protein
MKSGVVSPPWLGKRTCQYASAKSRESVSGAITNPGAVAVANPRGAYAPRSCVGVRMSAGEIAIFAMHKCTSAAAAGVSPPWVGNLPRLQGTANNVRRTPTSESRAAGVSPPWYGNRAGSTERFLLNEGARMPRGAYAPRSWCFCGADICRRNCDLCNTRTLVYTSGDRQPAVARETHLSVRFRKVAGVC